MNSLSFYRILAKNSLLFAIGSFSSRAVTFFLLPFYTYYLTPDEFGKIDVLLTTILLLIPLISLHAMEMVFRFAMDSNKSLSSTLMNGLFFCIIGFSVLVFFTPLIVRVEFIAPFVILFLSAFFFTMVDGVCQQFARGIGKIKYYVISEIIYTSIFALSNIILIAFMSMGINGYLISITLGHFISILFLFIFSGIAAHFSIRSVDPSLFKPMILYSLPLIPTAIMWWIMNVSNRYFISYFMDFESTGIFAVASKIPVIMITLNMIIFRAWQISAIEAYSKPGFQERFTNIYNTLSFFLVGCISIIIIFIKPFFLFIIAEEYYSAWKYVPFLLIGVFFSALSNFWGVIYIASKKTIGALLSTGPGAIINIILNIVLISTIGIYGAVVATIFAYFVMWVFRYLHIKSSANLAVNKLPTIFNLLLVFIQIYILFKIDNSSRLYFYQTSIFIILILSNYKTILKSSQILRA